MDKTILYTLHYMRQANRYRTLFAWIVTLGSLISAYGQSGNCAHQSGHESYLSNIACPADFEVLEGFPLSNNYSQIDEIKLVYDIKNDKLYFINSKAYKFHFDFCNQYLHYSKGLETFNVNEYGNTNLRTFILANLNYYHASGNYTLEFFSDDAISGQLIASMFELVRQKVYFKDQLRIVENDNTLGKLAAFNSSDIISVDQLFAGQTYQPMVSAISYGYIQKVQKSDYQNFPFKKEDIIITNFLPNDVPFCQGIMTTKFQTPLSHINVLSQNRHTPNCAYENAWDNSLINLYNGQLVRFEVSQDSFFISKATLAEAKIYWNTHSAVPAKNLKCNLKEIRLLDVKYIDISQLSSFGGKVSNFGELEKILLDDDSHIPLPECAFGIPFYYYAQHINSNNLQKQIDFILTSDTIYNNRTRLNFYLNQLQDSILSKPIDNKFYALLIAKLQSDQRYKNFRFRSSTNAEDIEGFTGAGLYTSKTGSLSDSAKSIERAIKLVWASLWTLRAFEERMNAHINQKNIAMGILVHRAFGTEEANGVAITKDLYRAGYPAFTINVQPGEHSVVLPKNDDTPEQFLIKFSATTTGKNDIAIDYITHSSINNYKPILSIEEIRLLASYLSAIKNHFYFKLNKQYEIENSNDFAMDIEFKLDKDTRKIYIKQARTY